MKCNMLMLDQKGYPAKLKQLHDAPKQIYWQGAELSEILKLPSVTVVGSRLVSPYGRQMTQNIVKRLVAHGISIVSGLALGIDAIAHQTAIDNDGRAIAVLPGPLDRIVPATNWHLAQSILKNDGTLVSEYHPGDPPYKQNFIARNRIMAALGDALLITEAAQKSGSLHTARFALEQGKTVMAIPGDITRQSYDGCNQLLKQGATIVTDHRDVLHVLGIDNRLAMEQIKGRNDSEQAIIDLLRQGISNGGDILASSGLEVRQFNISLVMLEFDGKIRPLGNNHWGLT